MIAQSRIIRDIYKKPTKLVQKVNFRHYLTNKREPVEQVSGINEANLDFQSKIIKDTHLQKRAFRKLASNLRFGFKI